MPDKIALVFDENVSRNIRYDIPNKTVPEISTITKKADIAPKKAFRLVFADSLFAILYLLFSSAFLRFSSSCLRFSAIFAIISKNKRRGTYGSKTR